MAFWEVYQLHPNGSHLGWFCHSRDIWQFVETILVVTTWRWSVLLTSNGQRQGMLLNILQCTGKFPTTKNYLVQDVNSAKVEKRCCVLLWVILMGTQIKSKYIWKMYVRKKKYSKRLTAVRLWRNILFFHFSKFPQLPCHYHFKRKKLTWFKKIWFCH